MRQGAMDRRVCISSTKDSRISCCSSFRFDVVSPPLTSGCMPWVESHEHAEQSSAAWPAQR